MSARRKSTKVKCVSFIKFKQNACKYVYMYIYIYIYIYIRPRFGIPNGSSVHMDQTLKCIFVRLRTCVITFPG